MSTKENCSKPTQAANGADPVNTSDTPRETVAPRNPTPQYRRARELAAGQTPPELVAPDEPPPDWAETVKTLTATIQRDPPCRWYECGRTDEGGDWEPKAKCTSGWDKYLPSGDAVLATYAKGTAERPKTVGFIPHDYGLVCLDWDKGTKDEFREFCVDHKANIVHWHESSTPKHYHVFIRSEFAFGAGTGNWYWKGKRRGETSGFNPNTKDEINKYIAIPTFAHLVTLLKAIRNKFQAATPLPDSAMRELVTKPESKGAGGKGTNSKWRDLEADGCDTLYRELVGADVESRHDNMRDLVGSWIWMNYTADSVRQRFLPVYLSVCPEGEEGKRTADFERFLRGAVESKGGEGNLVIFDPNSGGGTKKKQRKTPRAPAEDSSEFMLADMYRAQHGDRTLSDGTTMYRMNGAGHWRPAEHVIKRLVREVIEGYIADKPADGVTPLRNRLERGAVVESVLKILRTHDHPTQYVHDPNGDKFNADRSIVGCPSGVVDLRTREIRQARPDELVTMSLAVDPAFDPQGDSEGHKLWDEFLLAVFSQDREVVEWFQVYFGYALTGYSTERMGLYLRGKKGCGKSTLQDVLCAAWGDYGDTVDNDNVIVVRGQTQRHEAWRAATKGKRLLIVDDAVPSGVPCQFNAQALKPMISGEKLSASFKGRDPFTFRAQGKWSICGNGIPGLADGAMADRLSILSLNHRFEGQELVKGYRHKLTTPEMLAVVLGWAVEGAKKWFESEEGLTALPTKARKFSEGEKDLAEPEVAVYLRECVTITADPSISVKTGDLYRHFLDWAQLGDGCGRYDTQRKFTDSVAVETGLHCEKGGGGNTKVWKGFVLKTLPKAESNGGDDHPGADGKPCVEPPEVLHAFAQDCVTLDGGDGLNVTVKELYQLCMEYANLNPKYHADDVPPPRDFRGLIGGAIGRRHSDGVFGSISVSIPRCPQ